GRLDLHPLPRRDVSGHFAADDDRTADDLRVDDRRLADDQRVLRGDLAFDLTIDADGAFESELAGDFAAFAEVSVHLAAGGGQHRFWLWHVTVLTSCVLERRPRLVAIRQALMPLSVLLPEDRHGRFPFD